jgi:hypothetical protein
MRRLWILALWACGGHAHTQGPAPAAGLEAGRWLPANRARLEALMEARGRGGPGWDAAHPPVATFDWDNTSMKNDIGDATVYWMLRNDKILQPPERDWGQTSKALTAAARAALGGACDAGAVPGQPLPTSRVAACADAIYAIYDGGKTPGGEPAWEPAITLTDNLAYQWTAQLTAGYREDEVRGFARAALRENAAAPEGAVQTVGSHKDVTAWVRIYPEMHDLYAKLQRRGFEVWIVSASPQPFSEVVAAEVGIQADHVIGIRSVVQDGRVTAHIQGCGSAADGDDTLITFNQGKRCWINKVIFHAPQGAELARLEPPRRAVLAGGDSDTDVAFVQDATDLKLVLNRHKTELMCNAYANHGKTWLVQPMFIQPQPRRAEPFACSSTKDAAGQPLRDEAGQPMADQLDTIY